MLHTSFLCFVVQSARTLSAVHALCTKTKSTNISLLPVLPDRFQAFTWNLVSGIPAIMGAVLILALDDQFTNFQIAIILLLGAGSFILIGLTELLPDALSSTTDGKGLGDSLRKLGSFLFGALIIGIPLAFHAHCHADEGHENHDH